MNKTSKPAFEKCGVTHTGRRRGLQLGRPSLPSAVRSQRHQFSMTSPFPAHQYELIVALLKACKINGTGERNAIISTSRSVRTRWVNARRHLFSTSAVSLWSYLSEGHLGALSADENLSRFNWKLSQKRSSHVWVSRDSVSGAITGQAWSRDGGGSWDTAQWKTMTHFNPTKPNVLLSCGGNSN